MQKLCVNFLPALEYKLSRQQRSQGKKNMAAKENFMMIKISGHILENKSIAKSNNQKIKATYEARSMP